MALTPQWLDELRARITLSSVIMRTVKLRRAGREWKACCPFHNENTPSFTVNDEKGFYHCFGCGAHGDAIRWMTDQRGLSFIDAVQELASQAGVEVPRPDPRDAKRAEQRASLHDVMAAAQDWFADNLRSADGAKARDYLQRRGFDAHTIERFGFGYAPDNRNALKQAHSRFEEPMLIEAGLRVATEDRDAYDRFRGRLMLPIHDARGRVIAFGGRILDSDRKDAPKYLNSPDTPLFDKGRTLYNLHRAGPASRKSGRVVVVEGYMDVIALAAAGIEETVAPMGTALTEQQIELLWRMADKPILCFDGDTAGQRAAIRAAERALPLLRPGCSLQFVTLPAGMDPDDLIRRDGRAGMERLLEQPATLLDLIWNHERESAPHASPEDKAGLKARLMAHVEAIGDRDIAPLYRREWLERFSAFAFPPRERPQRGKPWRGGLPAIPAGLAPGTADRLRRGRKRDTLAQGVIAGLARHPDQIARHAEALLNLPRTSPELAPAIDALLHLSDALEAGAQNPISAPGTLPQPPDGTPFSFLMEGFDPQAAREDLAEAVALLVERPALDAAIAAATARFDSDPEGAFAEQQRLRKRKLEFESRLGQMARKRAALAADDTMETAGGGETYRPQDMD
jgi:DNA primase